MHTPILLICDDPQKIFFLENDITKRFHLPVTTQKSVEDAQKKYPHHSTKVIIFVSRELDTLDAIKRIQQTWPTAKVLCMVLLSFHQQSIYSQKRVHGIQHFFVHVSSPNHLKQWNNEVLLPTIQEYLQEKMGSREICSTTPSNETSIVVVASSCGGPIALRQLISTLHPELHTPILIAQHVPKMFDSSLCTSLNSYSDRTILLGEHGLRIQNNHIYLAPFDYHMQIAHHSTGSIITLNQQPKEHFLRPAADPLFRSAAKIYKKNTVAVILTGMGEDGTEGAKIVRAHGGTVICQDEQTSIMWGMPSSAIQANVHSKVLPIEEIGNAIFETIKKQN